MAASKTESAPEVHRQFAQQAAELDGLLSRRLLIGIGISLVLNSLLWWEASGFVHRHITPLPPPIEFTRVILPPKHPQAKKKVVKPKVTPPKPKPKLVAPKPQPKPPQQHVQARPAPKPTHLHVMTAQGPGNGADHTALAGGHAAVGQPIEHQAPETQPVQQPPPPQPQPEPQPEPKPAPKPEPPPQPKTQPKPVMPDRATPEIIGSWSDLTLPPDVDTSTLSSSSIDVEWDVDTKGHARNIKFPSTGNEEVDEAIRRFIQDHHFEPAVQGGEPQEAHMEHTFTLD